MTKYQHRVGGDRHLARMDETMRAVRDDFEGDLVEVNGEAHHVHLLVNFPPKLALSRLVDSLKGVSSRRLRQEFPDLARHSGAPSGCSHGGSRVTMTSVGHGRRRLAARASPCTAPRATTLCRRTRGSFDVAPVRGKDLSAVCPVVVLDSPAGAVAAGTGHMVDPGEPLFAYSTDR